MLYLKRGFLLEFALMQICVGVNYIFYAWVEDWRQMTANRDVEAAKHEGGVSS